MKPESFKTKDKAKEKGKIVAITKQDLGSDLGNETKIIAMALKKLKGKENETKPNSSIYNCHIEAPSEEKIIELFHVRVISKHTKVDTLFDSGSQANLISEDLVKKLNLEIIPHPKPYPLGWICKDENLQVLKKCMMCFAIKTHFIDMVELDVVPLDITGVVLVSPYLYGRKAILHHHEKNYHLFKDGDDFIVRSHRKKLDSSLVNAG